MSELYNEAGMIEVRSSSLAFAWRPEWRGGERGDRRRALPDSAVKAPGVQDNILHTVAFVGGELS